MITTQYGSDFVKWIWTSHQIYVIITLEFFPVKIERLKSAA